jgi:ribosomal protein L11 methyltransferase
VEDVLDRLLLLVPSGVREVPRGRHVELRVRGSSLPPADEIKRAAGGWPHLLTVREVPDDWRRRRLADYAAEPIGRRLVVRPEWAPRAPKGAIDIALSESAAFGAGTHPTTRACLEELLRIEPRGAFADLGCGTGVIAILAAALGWEPVLAVDVQPGCVEAAASNAAINGAAISVGVLDLSEHAPPPADGIAANVPLAVHLQVAGALPEPGPVVALLSGFGPDDADEVAAAYRPCGLSEHRRVDAQGWAVLVLGRD